MRAFPQKKEEVIFLISVSGLKKSYSGHLAVDDLSFEVDEGIVYGLLGPNGAGKSTTMNIITGYISATSGTVKIDGTDILEEPEKAKAKIGYLPEIPPLYPDLTVKEYLSFVCGLKKVPKDKKKENIEQALNLTGTKEVENRLIRNLSKGFKQRVGLAQALLGDPKVIILDEPTVGLDPKQIIEIRELIKGLAKKHTVILSSHILSEVSEICDKVLIINKGKLVACDSPENLSKHLADKTRLTVTVKAEKKKALHILQALPDVSEVTAEESSDGAFSFIVTAPGDKDIREEVSAALSKEGCLILGMTSENMSLEDVFLELTQDGENTEEDKK